MQKVSKIDYNTTCKNWMSKEALDKLRWCADHAIPVIPATPAELISVQVMK